MSKKTTVSILVIIILIAIIVTIIAVNKNKKVEKQMTQSEAMLNQSIKVDTTDAINKNLDSIKVDNTNIDNGIKSIDSQLNTL